MSKKTDNSVEKYKTNLILLMAFMGISIILSTINTHFSNAIGTVGSDILMLISSLNSIGIIVISFRILNASRLIKDNKSIQVQLNDERAKEIDNESSAVGFMVVIISTGAYMFFAGVLKFLFDNDYLYNLSGFFVSSIILGLGLIASAINKYRLDNK